MKPTILVFTRYYLPGYRGGGPIRTLSNLVEKLGDTFCFRIVTLDRDLGDDECYPGFQSDDWMPWGKALVRYVSPDRFGFRLIANIARNTPHDVIYLNSFFDPRFTVSVLLCRRLHYFGGSPVVIAPRGEFSEGALRLKQYRKRLFINLARLFGLYRNLIWQASSPMEADEIRRKFLVGSAARFLPKSRARIVTAPDLAVPQITENSLFQKAQRSRPGRPLRVCFVSRISPMKNLDFALRVLSEVGSPVVFSIYGPVEDATHWAVCRRLMRALPSHIEVDYKGSVRPDDVVQALAQQDLFLFPTRGENFGHVIYEALCAGLPVLVSDRTPWRNLEQEGVGWDLPLTDKHGFARAIDKVAAWTETEYRKYSIRAIDMAIRVGEDASTVEANESLFMEAIEHVASRSELSTNQRKTNNV